MTRPPASSNNLRSAKPSKPGIAPQFVLLKPAVITLAGFVVFSIGNVLLVQIHVLLTLIPIALMAGVLWYVRPTIQDHAALVVPEKVRLIWRSLALITMALIILSLVLMVICSMIAAIVATPKGTALEILALNGLIIFLPMLLGVGSFGLSIAAIMISSHQPNSLARRS